MANTVVMIHGMWGGPWYWSNYRRMFEAADYRCIAVTLPYHDMEHRGTPDARLGNSSLLDYCEAVEREIRQLDEKPILMGHSMGGLLAQMLAARGLAQALVLLSPASPAGILAITPSVIRSLWRIQTTWGFWRKPTQLAYSEAVYSTFHLLPEAEQKEAYGNMVWDSGKAIFEIGYWMLDSRGAARVDASRVICPVLVLTGTQDRITPVSVVRKVAQKYRAVATYKEFDNHAHWIVGEPGWEEVAKYALAWLDSQKNSVASLAVPAQSAD